MKILFLAGLYIYWLFEGITEAIATTNNPFFATKSNQDEYHLYRILENLGIVIMICAICIGLHEWTWLFRTVLGSISGIAVYEMFFNLVKYNNPLHNKTSKWLFIPHPKGWVWIPIFVVFSIVYLVV